MRKIVLVLAILLSIAASPRSGSERLYVVHCDGHVDVIATASGRRLRRVDVAATLPIEHRQSLPNATFDNCLLNQAIYAPRQSAFYSLVPNSYSEPQRFDLWRFAVPSLAAQRIRRGATSGEGVPVLASRADGSVSIALADEAPRSFDLAGSASASANLRSDLLERSGEAVLLRLYDPGAPHLALGVADRKRGTLVRLQSLPPTFAGFAHLAPGGGAVYVEQVTGTPKNPVMGGRATVFDAANGRALREVAVSENRAMSFLAIVPSGKAVYFGNDRYTVIALGERFANLPVTSARSASPAYFVAAQ